MQNYEEIISKLKRKEDKSINKGDKFVEKKDVVKYYCPECNCILKKRLSKFGDNRYWYGCSSYPDCKFTCGENQVINVQK